MLQRRHLWPKTSAGFCIFIDNVLYSIYCPSLVALLIEKLLMKFLFCEDIYLLPVFYVSNKNMEDDAPFKCRQEIQI